MNVTHLRVIATSGANKRPTYGEATFSDGQTYDWMVVPTDNSLAFFSQRKREGVWERFSFASKPRAAALNAKLEV